jgi:hypothetical protein
VERLEEHMIINGSLDVFEREVTWRLRKLLEDGFLGLKELV